MDWGKKILTCINLSTGYGRGVLLLPAWSPGIKIGMQIICPRLFQFQDPFLLD